MNELAPPQTPEIDPAQPELREQPQPGSADPTATDPGFTGFTSYDQNDDTASETLDRDDIDALRDKSNELRGMYEVQSGLEQSIIGAGLQVMADRYGADRLLEALQSPDGPASFQGVIAKLAPDKEDRKALYAAIEAEPMEEVAERFNQTLGGVTDGNNRLSAMERLREFDVTKIKGEMRRPGPRIPMTGANISVRHNKSGHTDSAFALQSGDFDSLLASHPELVESFRETNNTFELLKGVRDIYGAEYAQFSAELEHAKGAIEALVATGETEVAELEQLSDEIHTDEIVLLEKRLERVAENEAAKKIVEDMLDRKEGEVLASREVFKSRRQAVRGAIVQELGAEVIYGLFDGGLIRPQPIVDMTKRQTQPK